jgi:predicted ArsR family transcriptional regulator
MAGRKPETAGEGYMTIQEAADALGITTNAIRGRLQRGTLEGRSYQRETSSGTIETRYEVLQSAVEKELAERSRLATREDVAGEVAPLGEEMRDLARQILSEIQANRETVSGSIRHRENAIVEAVNRMAEGLERNNELLLVLNRCIQEDINRSQPYRDKVERYLDGLAKEKGEEAGEAIEESDTRPWWRKLFS